MSFQVEFYYNRIAPHFTVRAAIFSYQVPIKRSEFDCAKLLQEILCCIVDHLQNIKIIKLFERD